MVIGGGSSTDSTMKNEGLDDRQMNNDEIKKLVKFMEKKLEEVSSLQSYYEIYRVPKQLQKLKPEAYTPLSVSVGLLHYNEEHLRRMETHKLRYLNRLLNQNSGKTLEFYVKAMSNLEEEARKCYSDIVGFGKDEFVKMMVIDGCFILEFLEIRKLRKMDHFRLNDSWCLEIKADLIKLENQLPFFVLKHLYGLIFDHPDEFPPQYNSFLFNHHIYVHLIEWFTEAFLRPVHLNPEQIELLLSREGGALHFLHFLRCVLIPSSPTTRINNGLEHLQLPYSASELKSAGVKFHHESSPTTSLFDIEFDVNKGVLTIPTITIWDEAELILRNLIAFEQDQPYAKRYFTAYAGFMDDLIDTSKDVELLVQKGIIRNRLGSPKDVVTLFNNITKHVVIGNPYFSGVVKDLEDYHDRKWNKWKAVLRQTYFITPWALISVCAAGFLLILTIIQTICSILQV